jgi:hypothetical protein
MGVVVHAFSDDAADSTSAKTLADDHVRQKEAELELMLVWMQAKQAAADGAFVTMQQNMNAFTTTTAGSDLPDDGSATANACRTSQWDNRVALAGLREAQKMVEEARTTIKSTKKIVQSLHAMQQ